MVRLLAFLVGLFFSGMLLIAFGSTIYGAITEPAAATAEHEFHLHPKDEKFTFDGPLGKYSVLQRQRGLKVFREVCSNCHSLHLVSFRDFADLGYNEAQIKTIAADWPLEQPSINPDTGEPATRKNLPSDRIPKPFANDEAAKAANNNAIPPDLSLITKARHDGPAYVYSLLTGFQNQPAELLKKFPDAKTPAGLHYNPYFPNLNLAMAPPLTSEGQVSYDYDKTEDGKTIKPTVAQMSKDVAAFLAWTAEPKLENRRQGGWAALGFLLIFTYLTFLSYRNIWADKKH